MSRCLKLAATTVAWLAMATFAATEPATSPDAPSGDVWITPDAPYPPPPQAAQNSPLRPSLPSGDFWPAAEGGTRTADAPAPAPDTKAKREEVAGTK